MQYLLWIVIAATPMTAVFSQCTLDSIPSLVVCKKKKNPFAKALALPRTAPSCNCPAMDKTILQKIGCQHPDKKAVCQVVVTQFDMAVIPEVGKAIVFKDVQGSFITKAGLSAIQKLAAKGRVFVSYTNIRGINTTGKAVVLPPFGTTTFSQRAQRHYYSVYDLLDTSTHKVKVETFEIYAYNKEGQRVFRHTYQGPTFDKNAMRPDAVRFVFKNIKARHEQGFSMEMDDLEVDDLEQYAQSITYQTPSVSY